MSLKTNYDFYIAKCDKDGKLLESERNIEDSFKGIRYLKASSLNAYGKNKVYTESFAEYQQEQIYIPEKQTNESNTVTFDFIAVGENRYSVYDSFVKYISAGFHRYRDTARNKYLYFYVSSEIKPSEEKWYGTTPYIKFSVEVNNYYGVTFDEPLV